MSPTIDPVADDAVGRVIGREPSDDPAADRAVTRMLKRQESQMAELRTRALIAEPPSQRAAAVGISQRSGVPLRVVEQDLPRHENEDRLARAGFGFIQSVPPLRRLMSDPEVGPVAMADSDALTAVARGLSLTDPSSPGGEPDTETTATLFGVLSGRGRRGLFSLRQGTLGTKILEGIATDEDREEFTAMRRIGPDPVENIPGPLDDFLGAGIEALPSFLNMGVGALQGAAVGLPAGFVLGLPGGIPGAVALGTAAAGTAAVTGALLSSFKQEAGNALAEFMNAAELIEAETGEVIPIEAIHGAAWLAGGVNAGLELVGARHILPLVPGAEKLLARLSRGGARAFLLNRTIRDRLIGFGKKLFRAGAGEGVTEGLQEFPLIIGENALATIFTSQDRPLMTIDEFVDRVLPAAGQGAMAGVFLGGGTGTIGGVANEINRIATSRSRAARLDALVEAANSSELREQLPGNFADYVNEVAQEKAEDQNVYIDAGEFTTYFQAQGIDLKTLESVIPEVMKQLPEALAAGRDLVIPMGDYLAHLGPQHHEGLKPNLRTGIAGVTPNETAALEKGLPEQFAAQAEAQVEVIEAVALIEESADKVFENVLGQLTAAGQAPAIAEQQAVLMREAAKTRAFRLGRTDVFELFQELGLRIEGPGAVVEPTEGLTLEQREGEPRGALTFGPELQGVVLRLFEAQNLSTFFHESGHLYLETLRLDSSQPRAPEQLRQDFELARAFLGAARGKVLTTKHHEKWARAFEQYLFEGKAPSAALQGMFARARAWLLSVYRSIRSLGEPLTPEIREVMDRLLATDAAIEAVRQSDQFLPAFTDAESAGMTEAEFAAYGEAGQLALAQSKRVLDRESLAEITRTTKAEWKRDRAAIRERTEAEVDSTPLVQAQHWLETGEALVGEAPEGLQPQKLSGQILGEVRNELDPRVWQEEGGLHPDTVAELFGLNSGDELVQGLRKQQDRNQLIEQITDEVMLSTFGDILNDGTIQEKAVQASMNNPQGTFLVAEQRALARLAGAQPLPAKIAREAAKRIIAERRIRDLRPDLYRNAEQRQAKAAAEAISEQDFVAANEAKRKQVLNHYLGREALKAREQAIKNRAFLAQFNEPKTRDRIGRAGEGYLDQIDGLLERFDLRQSVTLRAADRRAALADWIIEREEAGDTLLISPELRSEAFSTPWRSLTIEEFQGVTDAVKNIQHLARLKGKLLASKEKREFDEVVEELVRTILTESPVLVTEEAKEQTKLEGFQSTLNSIHAAHLKLEFVFRRLDGFKDLGPVWTALFKPFVDAEFAESQMQKRVAERFSEIFGKIPRQTRASWKTRRIHIPETGDSFTREGIIAIALNSGNVDNIIALKQGFGWDDAQLQAVLKHLTKEEIQAVNEIWQLVDSFWPEIAELQRELTGLAPKKVEGEPLQIANGLLGGGYYPLKADTRHSFLAFRRDEKEKTLGMFESNWLRPQTQQGHTIERVGFGGQKVKLSLSVLSEHLHNVAHDITHRKALIQVDRLTQNDEVREAIQAVIGREQYRVFRPWLKAIAGDRQPVEFAYEKLLSRARAGTTIAYMGFKFTTSFAQLAGLLNSADRVGLGRLTKALEDFYIQSPMARKRQRDFAMERSKVLPTRMQNFDREARDLLKRGGLASGPLGELNVVAQQSYLKMIGLFDMGVSIPTWFAGYAKGMEQFQGDEQKAIDLADQAIRLSQGAGTVKDLAAIQRGGELQRMFVNFYSYFSVLYNQGAERIVQIRQGNITLPTAAASAFYLWFGPALISELLAGRGPEEDEEWWKWAAAELTRYPFMAVVGARDVVGHAINRLQGKPFDFRLTPLTDVFGTTAEAPAGLIKDIADGEIRRTTVKTLFEAVSFWGPLPGRQVWITLEALYDLLTDQGEVIFPRDFLFTRPPERRASR
ncbi:MAG: hypothetical protein V3R16_02430 [Nitrospirales bacterium]